MEDLAAMWREGSAIMSFLEKNEGVLSKETREMLYSRLLKMIYRAESLDNPPEPY